MSMSTCTSESLINVTARPRSVTVYAPDVQTLSARDLGLARKPTPVVIRVDLHDEYYVAEQKRWKRRLAEVHPDRARTVIGRRRAAERFRELSEDYADWIAQEQQWYRIAGLKPPTWGRGK